VGSVAAEPDHLLCSGVKELAQTILRHYNNSMLIEFDTAKDQANQEKHGIPLAAAASLDWGAALIRQDARKDYNEARYQALGMLDDRLYFVAFTVRGDAIRVISMRKANKREERQYVQT
jgi:uncharacterized DUF497 family protein